MTAPGGATRVQASGAAVPLRHVTCPLCGADDAVPVVRGRDRWHGLPGRFRMVRCCRCGLCYQDPQPTPEALHLCYPADYQAYRPREGRRATGGDERLGRRLRRRLREAVLRRCHGYPGRGPWWAWAVWPCVRLDRRAGRLIPFRRPGRLLDVGCGTGEYLERMRHVGWQVAGVEPNEAAARYAR